MQFSPLLEQLVHALRCLPGVGPKSAQRMALHLLIRGRGKGEQLAHILHKAIQEIGLCEQCRILSETPLCGICASATRDKELLCIVENPIDVTAIEQTVAFKGKYFVLLGHLSPLDGIGPDDIGMPQLANRLASGEITEIILATNPTIEGEATAHYITELAKPYTIQISRLARGVALGSELEYVDPNTLMHALSVREKIK